VVGTRRVTCADTVAKLVRDGCRRRSLLQGGYTVDLHRAMPPRHGKARPRAIYSIIACPAVRGGSARNGGHVDARRVGDWHGKRVGASADLPCRT
jgi:hypothetical protein